MNRLVHDYYHRLMWVLTKAIEPKFDKGDKEHGHKGMLWDMPDKTLLANFDEEIMDAIVYWAEIQRRKQLKGKRKPPKK